MAHKTDKPRVGKTIMDRNKIVMDNARLVFKVIRGMHLDGLSYHDRQDIVQVGFCGLIAAVDRYDPSRGALSTIAYRYIQGAILNYLRESMNTIHVSRNVEVKLAPYIKSGSLLADCPDVDKIAKETGIARDRLVAAINAKKPIMPIIEERKGEGHEEEVVTKLLLEQAINSLDDRSRACIREYFFNGKSQREVAITLGISFRAACYWIQKALDKMRAFVGAV